MATVHDYFSAQAFVAGGRDKRSRPIENNTRVESRYDAFAVRLHGTDVATYRPDGWVILNTGGWHTVTTFDRLNRYAPAPWRVASDGKGGRMLYRSGRAITPFVDGLSVHESGAVGMNGAALLTAADVDAIAEAADAAAVIRADKRAALLLRQHPAVNAPRAHRGYDQRAYDCGRCQAESEAERIAERARLTAEHAAMLSTLARNPDAGAPWSEAEYAAAGSHVRRDTVREYPPLPGGRDWQHDYTAEPIISERVKVACPWSCPGHTR